MSCQGFCFLGYKAVQDFLRGILSNTDGGRDTFLRDAGWHSTDYTARQNLFYTYIKDS
jgi:hypothetical protein